MNYIESFKKVKDSGISFKQGRLEMVVYEITRDLPSVNITPFYISLTAVQCADFMEENHIYVRNRRPLSLSSLFSNKEHSFDTTEIPRLLLDISTQIETLWSMHYTLLPFDEQDVYKIGDSYCVLSPDKVTRFEPKTLSCSLMVPVRLGHYLAPEVCSCLRLPCQTFCGKYTALYSLGIMAKNIMEDELDDDSHIGTIIRNLTHDNPSRRIPVIF